MPIKDAIRLWCRSTINHHKHAGYDIEFTIDELVEFIGKNTTCSICGKIVDFSYGNKGRASKHYSPSLDRVDNETTLTLDNVQLLCQDCNRTKGNRTMKDFVKYCTRVSLLHGWKFQ